MLRNIILGILVIGVVYFSAAAVDHNPKEKESAIIEAVLKYLDVLHFSPKEINDEFSLKVYDNYIKSIDPAKRFLIQPEVDKLATYKTAIDDEIQNRSLEFFDTSLDLITVAITRSQSIYEEVLDQDIDLYSTETFNTSSEDREFASNEAELREYWRKSLTLDIINKIDQKLEEQEKDSTLTELKTLEEIKADAVADTKKNFDNWYKRLDKIRRSDRFENYVNAIMHVFDPHSDYYNPKEKEDFDIRMGGKLEGIGARLSEDGEYTKVVSIVPGGPAWKGKELEVNDLIVAVTQDGEEPVDITGMRLDDVVAKIRGDKGTIVILKVKRNGTFLDVSIERDEVILDEGFARSLKVGIPDMIENIGYIKLPKFYSSFEGKEGSSCAVDVAKEIDKLNTENINGLILDLRNNGGGSLQDVITMSGLFIENGPIVQVKSKERRPQVYDDRDAGVKYDGPLIVLVNQFSASASEILAAALQDYDRAVIVGSTSTFGKGTVQRFQNLDQYIQGMDDMKPLGQIKLTNQKFYRINGGSTQLEGVTPDIVLPDTYTYIDSGEKEYDNALPWTQIDPLSYKQDVYIVKDKEALSTSSEERVRENPSFKVIEEQAQRIKSYRDEEEVSLNLDTYRKQLDQRELESKLYDDVIDQNVDCLSIENLEVDTALINSDESRKARNDDWLENIQKDIYLEEALYIMKDIIMTKS